MLVPLLSIFVHCLLSARHLEGAGLDTGGELKKIEEWTGAVGWKMIVIRQTIGFLKLANNTKLNLYRYYGIEDELGRRALFTCGHDEVGVDIASPEASFFVAGTFADNMFIVTNAGQIFLFEVKLYLFSPYAFSETWIEDLKEIKCDAVAFVSTIKTLTEHTGRTLVRCWIVETNIEMVTILRDSNENYSFVTTRIDGGNITPFISPVLSPTLVEAHGNVLDHLRQTKMLRELKQLPMEKATLSAGDTTLPAEPTTLPVDPTAFPVEQTTFLEEEKKLSLPSGWLDPPTSRPFEPALKTKLLEVAPALRNFPSLSLLADNHVPKDTFTFVGTLWKVDETISAGKTLLVVWLLKDRGSGNEPEYILRQNFGCSSCREDAGNLFLQYVEMQLIYPLTNTYFENGVEWIEHDESNQSLYDSLSSISSHLPNLDEQCEGKWEWEIQKVGLIPSRLPDGTLTMRLVSVWKTNRFVTLAVVRAHILKDELPIRLEILYVEEPMNGENALAECQSKYYKLHNIVYQTLPSLRLTWDFMTLESVQNFLTTIGEELKQCYGQTLRRFKPIFTCNQDNLELVLLRSLCEKEESYLYASIHPDGLRWPGHPFGFHDAAEELKSLNEVQQRAEHYPTLTFAFWTPLKGTVAPKIKKWIANDRIVEIFTGDDGTLQYSYFTQDGQHVWTDGPYSTIREGLGAMSRGLENPFLMLPLQPPALIGGFFHSNLYYNLPNLPKAAVFHGFKTNGSTFLLVYIETVASSDGQVLQKYSLYTGVHLVTHNQFIVTHIPAVNQETAGVSIEKQIALLDANYFWADMTTVCWFYPDNNNNGRPYFGPTPWEQGKESPIKVLKGRSVNFGNIDICSDGHLFFFAIRTLDGQRWVYVGGATSDMRLAECSSQNCLVLPTGFSAESTTDGISWYLARTPGVDEVIKIIVANTEYAGSPVCAIGLLPSTAEQQLSAVFQYGVVFKIDEKSFVPFIVEVQLTYFGLPRRSGLAEVDGGQKRGSITSAKADIAKCVKAVQVQNVRNILSAMKPADGDGAK